MSLEFKKIILLGGSGILGMGLQRIFHDKVVLQTPKSEIGTWLGTENLDGMKKYFSNFESDSIVINALGITDPKASIEQLELLNSILPARMLSALNGMDIKLITFGTILEKYTALGPVNPYVKSKQDFFNRIQETPATRSHLHLQLHTIYGSRRSHNHMFIEQIFNSLRSRSVFEMSSGFQVREYHHIEDEAQAIAHLLERNRFGVIELNAGNAVQIKKLATKIFEDFGQIELLKFNLALDGEDVYNQSYQKSEYLQSITFRDPIIGVISYLRNKFPKGE